MAYLIRNVIDGYHDLMDNKSGKYLHSLLWGNYLKWRFSDPRVNDWFLMSSPFPTLCMCLSYAYIVKVLGPKLMENRKPFDLKYILIFYNLVQVIFSLYLFHEVSKPLKFSWPSVSVNNVSSSRAPWRDGSTTTVSNVNPWTTHETPSPWG